MSKAKQLSTCQARVDHAKRWRKTQRYDSTWQRMNELYQGIHYTDVADTDRIAVNMAFSTANVIFPSVTINHPKITVQARRYDDADRSVIMEAVVNYFWKHYDFQAEFRRAAKDFVIMGHGWLKVGWRFAEAEAPKSEADIQAEIAKLMGEAEQFAQTNPEMMFDLPDNQEIADNVSTTTQVVVEDRPFVERVSPFDVFVDPEATHLGDAAWVAQRVVRPLEEAKRDKAYRRNIARSLKATTRLSDETEQSKGKRNAESDPTFDRVVVWEYWNLRDQTVCVFADGCDDFLVEPRKMPFELPFVMLRNYDVPDKFYPIGDLQQIESLQLELNATRTQMQNSRKHMGRKYLYNERSFDSKGRAALESDEDNTMVPVVDETKPLNQVVVPFPATPLNSEVFQHSAQVEADIDVVTGLNEYSRGALPEVRRTATEASIIQDASNARSADKLAIIEKGIAEVARRVMKLSQKYLEGEHAIRIAGGAGEAWFVFTPEDIEGEFDFDVEAGSTQPMNDTVRRQQAIAMLNALAPFIGTVIDPVQMATHALQAGFGIKNPERFLVQQAQPPMGAEGEQPQGDPFGQPEPNLTNGRPMPPETLAVKQTQPGLNPNSLEGQR